PAIGDWQGGWSSSYTLTSDTRTLTDAGLYRITFSTYCGVDTKYFNLTPTTVPSVSNVPASLPICPPQAVTYNATVSGATSLQWQQSINGSWTNISGATSAAWTTPLLTTPGTYYYRLAATNSCGTAYSTTSTVTVMPTPTASVTGPCSIAAGETA